MDIHDLLDEALSVLDAGKARAFGGGAVVDRDRLIEVIGKVRTSLPEEIVEARALLAQRESILAAANDAVDQQLEESQQRAAAIIADAETQHTARVAEHEVLRAAGQQAEEMLADAGHRAEQMRAEVDDYVAAKLESLSGTLSKALAAVEAGRQRVADAGRQAS